MYSKQKASRHTTNEKQNNSITKLIKSSHSISVVSSSSHEGTSLKIVEQIFAAVEIPQTDE